MIYDCVIIGAGASGLYCAARLLSSKALNVAVIDSGSRPGRKLLMTGGGRCNLTNRSIDISKYYTDDPACLSYILSSHGSEDSIRFFADEIGLSLSFENDLVYPSTYRASTVLDSLLLYLKEHGCRIILDTPVSAVGNEDGLYDLGYDIKARTVVFATGGASYPETGSNGSFTDLLRTFQGIKITPLSPSLVPLRTAEKDIYALSGKRVKCSLELYSDKRMQECVAKSKGEMLFTDYGISGICVLDISGYAVRAIRAGRKPVVKAVLCDEDKVRYNLSRFTDRTAADALSGILMRELVSILLERAGIDMNRTVSSLNNREIEKVIEAVKEMKLTVTGSRSFDQAQVTAGGVDISSLNEDLSVPGNNGLFICGESLNCDGICGGYNLQFAWSSADLVSKGVIRCLS